MKKQKSCTETEFLLFRSELEKTKHGKVLAALATVQYNHALRISEATGIYHEDIFIDFQSPANSRIFIRRSVAYLRQKGIPDDVKPGSKNSDQFEDGVKELPLFPQAYEVLKSLVKKGQLGFVLTIDGKAIKYRKVQYYYDLAFKRANLPYTATHVLRHGWTRKVFNSSLNFEVAKQLLGDKSDSVARI